MAEISELGGGITRRRLLQAGAGVAGGLALYRLPSFAHADNVDEVDYVVIGSGPGGAPLAANLAEAGFTVLVLEAGPAHGNQNYYRCPVLAAQATRDPAVAWDFYVRHYTDAAAHGAPGVDLPIFTPERDGVLYPRSSTLGGCTAHHNMLTVYPEHADWQFIRDLTGDPGWHPELMWNHYGKVQTWQPFENVAPTEILNDQPMQAVIGSAQEENAFLPPAGLPGADLAVGPNPNDRHNVDRSAQGWYPSPQGTRNGQRVGPRERLLAAAAAHPNRLTIATNALAERIRFENAPGGAKRAVSVSYLSGAHLYSASPSHRPTTEAERDGLRRHVRVRREVIVAGGAYNSPQLLMLSGIGPRDHLRSMGVPVQVDLPGVGTNLQDRYEVAVVAEYEQEWAAIEGCMFDDHDDPCFDRWNNATVKSTQLYSSNGIVSFIKRRYSQGPSFPEMVLFGAPVTFYGFREGWVDRAFTRPINTFSWLILKGYARSRAGTVRLRSNDPTATPAVNKRSFDDNTPGTYDAAAMIEGIESARRINSRVDFPHHEVYPGPGVTDLDRFIRQEQYGHHVSCTNPMGAANDAAAVLDGKLRVRGTSNLRVVDASAFPRIVGTFLWLPTAIMSEKASADVLAAA